ncbi:MAG: ketol-acid reductoisomerase [Candidatus Marinimicrobia bacterium]|jgi:ketol-acid reductoisomerase|nr:ketol-acid reductoisomerase [Candidatus Neomarinimicrobiota bacterium]MDP6457603.1 ketol-acid reductoisomerase [Candidatus Neomarinimicrobiota bacterium]MDP6593147.1 ketol-acid reductoisomerase [Candidatus Neomarinimicrobiota bacterium]MDP6836979.1 ketol-acid reductoisomerase [Candidatus Neomarinimicrobiota bacterium]|tara:strand:+ start:5172 stop:6224 length:1053 start_codon:yes stop_codon:yes gene_type:complete
MKEININGYKETIIERSDYPADRCREILKDEVSAILGYGPQGRGQGLNMRDQGFNVIVGLRKGQSWNRALDDGWVEGENLFELDEAAHRGTVLHFLLSDAGQIQAWPTVQANLQKGDALFFSHGFGVVFHTNTGIVPPEDVDVFLVAPKGSGLTVRNYFLNGRGINASYAIHQDKTGRARERCLATAFAIGSGHLFETTFEKEVYSDLTGERCVLMGLLQGAFLAQYEVLREHGHSPSEAYNETIEEALQSLYPLVSEKGMDWMYANCSTTAQRGALDWAPRFKDTLKPVIEECYRNVTSGEEAKITIESNSRPDYRDRLEKELEEVNSQEMWQAGQQLRPLRPENLPSN